MESISALKNNKTSGKSGIIAETWKRLNEDYIGEVTRLFQEIWTRKNTRWLTNGRNYHYTGKVPKPMSTIRKESHS